jgi:hypothetical protein
MDVRQGAGDVRDSARASAGSLLRRGGRVILWAAVALLLVRGLASVIAGPGTRGAASAPSAPAPEDAASAAAVRFARAYLEDPSPEALQPFLAAGARIGAGRPPSARDAEVAQAEVVRASEVGDGRQVLTVACELRDSRTLYLAVPIVRFRAGEVAVLGAPSIVAVPAVAGADPERPRPLPGPEAGAIEALVGKFLPAYLAAGSESDLSYLLAPGAEAIPLGGSVHLLGVSDVSQLGSGEGPRRTLLVAARVSDPSSGATYPLAYRLAVVKQRDRWYVSSVQGAVS